jgi:diguanylate cyclase (GGDEF)-like protein
MINRPPPSLSHVIDHFIAWHGEWLIAHLQLVGGQDSDSPPALPPHAEFHGWFTAAALQLPQGQPAMDRLAITHDQLNQLVKLVNLKSPGFGASEQDLAHVTGKYLEFITGLRQLERALAIAASGLDPLTGLRSRVGMMEDLKREQERGRRHGKPFCVALADIDHFKAINDTHGHDAGDRVLAAVADYISRSLRVFDDAYRLGGEEFLLCFKETDLPGGLAILERIRQGLQNLSITLRDGLVITITASFGLVAAGPDSAMEDLINRADQALYRAKQQGRNRISVVETP